jgi:HEAT repeat protein
LLAVGQPLAVRREAARLLATALPPLPATAGPLSTARAESDPELRGWAALAAARLGERQAIQQLIAIVQAADASGKPPDTLAVHAALALADGKSDAAVPVLMGALSDCGDLGLCRRVIAATGALGDRRATAALLGRLDSVLTRREVVAALGQLADPASTPALIARLERDEYVPVRAEAAAALARIGGPAARAALRSARQREKEPVVLSAVAAALQRLGP